MFEHTESAATNGRNTAGETRGRVSSLRKSLLGLNNSHLRYAAFRWIMPRLGHEPHTNYNLAQNAWPQVSALTAPRGYGERIESVDSEQLDVEARSALLKERATQSDPVVLRDYYPEARDLDLDWVKAQVGDTVGPVRVGNYASIAGDSDIIRMRTGDFVDFAMGRTSFPVPDHLVPGMGPYLANIKLPEIADQLPQPKSFFPKAPVTTFWFGVDSFTPLHCHQFCDVLLVQITGERRVVLVPPHQSVLVGSIARTINICTANYNPFAPADYPAAGSIQQPYCDLGPGDALLIPGFWFHAVRLTGSSFSGSQFNEAVMPLAIGGGPRAPWHKRPYKRGWG